MGKKIGNLLFRIIRRIRKEGFFHSFMYAFLWVATSLFNRKYSRRKAIRIMEEDWDHLIVLDACRYDMFREIVDENAGYAISGGCNTKEWMIWNFKRIYRDVVCIAGNPHLAGINLEKTLGHIPFHKVYEVWDYGWDDSLKTVSSRAVTESAIKAVGKFPDKRLLIHYFQPHHPFIADKYLLEKDEGTWKTMDELLWGDAKLTVWDYAQKGQIPIERVWKAYKDNLRLVMKEVRELLEHLDGKVIITADHGNHVGEYWIYGHRYGVRTEQLVKVPWHVLKERKAKKVKTGKDGDGVPDVKPSSEMALIGRAVKGLQIDGKEEKK